MKALADQTAKEVDQELEDREAKVLRSTTVDWDSLRPRVTDPKVLDQLRSAVEKSTAKNESLAQLVNRVSALGKQVVSMAKEVVKIVG